MLKREENQLKQDSEKKKISETVIRKKENLSENSDKEKYRLSDRMLKTIKKKKNAPREGRGCAVAKAKPQNLFS